jgi:hypothetical protein
MKNTLKNLFKGVLACATLLMVNAVSAQYCSTATANCTLDDEIQIVNFAGINNSSVCTSGYADYTAGTAATVTAGLSYTLDVTVGPGGNEAVGVWIDYDQNQVFDADEFTYVGNAEGGLITNSIAIPSDATPGATRMRVRNYYVTTAGNPATIYLTTPNSSCATISTGFGETEDYTVNIIGGTDCDGTPSVGAATASVENACSGESFTLNAAVTPIAAGLSYQWQSSIDGGTTWVNLGAAQVSASYIVIGQTVPTGYQVIVTCTASSQTATSAPISVGQNAPSECYCINAVDFVCNDGDIITNVTIGFFTNDSDCPADETGYSDFTALGATDMTAGAANPVSVTVGPSGGGWLYESVGVWIDYNQNGTFEESEYTYLGTSLNATITNDINIPATALNGNTRLRIVDAASTAAAFTAAYSCGPLTADNPYGEMEDYLVNITGGLSTKSFNSAQASVFPNPTNGIVTIRLNNQDSLQSIGVYNITGQQVMAHDYAVKANDYTLNLQQLPSGVYMLKLNGASGTYTQKLIKN